MENKQQAGGLATLLNESSLATFKRYFPYVIIIALSWYIVKLEGDKKELNEARIIEAKKQAEFWRESSEKSLDILEGINKDKNRRNENNQSE